MTTEIRDILLFMVSYPNRTPSWALDMTRQLAEQVGARISGVLCRTHIPAVGNWLANKLVHIDELSASENARSREAATDLLAEFSKLVGEDRRGEQFLVECGLVGTSTEPARHARTHDLTVVPVEANVEFHVATEALIFDSGRPVLLLPRPSSDSCRFDDIIIGWDGSRSAARALAASLPFCQRARSVRLVAVSGDKPFDCADALGDARRHLACHDITSRVEVVDAGGKDAGSALMEHAITTDANLLIMGAFGHSRTLEFVLGGATRSVLGDPRLAVLVSH